MDYEALCWHKLGTDADTQTNDITTGTNKE